MKSVNLALADENAGYIQNEPTYKSHEKSYLF